MVIHSNLCYTRIFNYIPESTWRAFGGHPSIGEYPSSRKEDWFYTYHLKVERNYVSYDAFTLDVKSMLNENLNGILGGTQMLNGQ
jgi:hypothetical protein